MTVKPNGKPATRQSTANVLGDFDQIVEQLRIMLDSVQSRVVTLTSDLQTAAEISTQVANILELNKLLPELAEAIKRGFDLHHVNIYLVNDNESRLVLTAASGTEGKKLLSKGYSVSLNDTRNMAAEAVRQREVLIANDTSDTTLFDFNDLIEGARAKLAVPMFFRERIIGVLTLQRDTPNSFNDGDVRVKTILAEQIAVAVENASAFARVQEVRAELLLSNQAIQASNSGISIADMTKPDQPLMFINPAFTRITGYDAEEVLGKNCRFLQAADNQQPAIDRVREAIREGTSCTVELRNYRKDGTLFWNELSLAPLYDDDGNLTHFVGVQTDITNRKQAEQRETLAYELAQQLNAENDPSKLLQITVDRIAQELGYYHAHIYRYDPNADELVVAAGLGEPGQIMVQERHHIPYNAPQSLVARSARDLKPVIVQDVSANANHLPNPLIPLTRSEAAIPLHIGDELLGVLDLQADKPYAFTDDELRLLDIIASQLAVALSNVKRLQETQLRMRDVQIGSLAAQIIIEADEIEEMVSQILELITSALGNDNAVFTELNPVTKQWHGLAGAVIDRKFVHTIVEDYQNIPHAVSAIESGKVVVVNNAYDYPDFPMEYVENIGIKSVAAMPIIGRRSQFGVAFFNFNSNFHTFTPEEITLLESIANQIANGIESKRLEAETRRAADRFRALIDNAPEAIFVVDPMDGKFLQASQSALNLYETTLSDILTKNTLDFAPEFQPDGRSSMDAIVEAMQSALQGNPAPLEINIKTGSGKIIPVEIRGVAMQGDDGEPVLRASVLDITARKEAELERNRVYEMSLDLIGTASFGGYFTDLNPAWERTLGFTPAELKAEPFISFVHPDDVQATLDAAAGLAEGVPAINFVNRYRTKRGNYRWLSWNSTPDYERQMIYFVVHDITEERQREQERNRIYDMSVDLIGSATFAGYFTELNPAWERTLGFTPDELKAEPFINFVHPDDTQSTLDAAAGLADGVPAINFTNRYRTKSGNYRWLSWNSTPDYERQMIYFVVHDITEAREQEEAIRRRAEELALVSEVSSRISSILDVTQLVREVARITAQTFDLYHIHIWLMDKLGERLTVAAGDGRAPCHHVEHAYTIYMDEDEGLVTKAALERKMQVARDATTHPDFLPSGFLPETRSQITIPMIIAGELLGVVDIHSDKVDGFNDDDVLIQSTLASQITVAVQNARTYAGAQRRAAELQTVSQIATEAANNLDLESVLLDVCELTKKSFDLYHSHIYLLDEEKRALVLAAGAGEAGRQMRQRGHSIQLTHPHSVVALCARTSEGVIVNDVTDSENFLPNPLLPETRAELAIPLIVNNRVIGVLDVQSNEVARFGEEDLTIKSILAGQIAISLQNSRSFVAEQEARRQNERRARELETVARVSAAASTILDVDELLSNVVELTKSAFDLYHAHIYLYNEDTQRLELAAGAGEAGAAMKKHGHNIDIKHKTSIVASVARSRKGLIVNDVTEAENFLPNPLLPQTRSEIALPMIVGDDLIGVLDVQSEVAGRFTAEDLRIKSTLAAQVAIAVRNARAFVAEQESRRQNERRARELETVAQVSAAASSILNVESLLSTVAELTKSAFDLYHAQIYLYDKENKSLRLAAGAGEAGAAMKQRGHRIAYNHPNSIVASAARERKGVLVNDVRAFETFLPNPILPNTRAEIAVPMLVGNELIGVLDVQSSQIGGFTEEDLTVEATLAAQIAVAVQNASAYEQSLEATERMREAAERLREVDRLKSEFLASMSHELRTPLNSIIGYSEVLLDGGDGDLPEEAVEDVDIIYNSGKHLLSIINDILDLAKIEANQMQLKRSNVDLVKLMHHVLKTNEVLLNEKPVELRFESEVDELIVPIDELRIRQILLNLFSNAVKFTEEGSVTLHLNMVDNETVRIAVVDTGIGISAEGQKIVFDQFRQVDGSSTRKAGGTGLGLAITRHLVRMHGGEIHVESKEGEGSTFWFTLPLLEPEEAHS